MKASERHLAAFSAALLALIGGAIFSQKLLAWQRSLTIQAEAAAAELAESRGLVAEAPAWRARGDWLSANQPVAKNDFDADNELFETLLTRAQAVGVSVMTKQYQERVNQAYFQQHGVTLTVKGDLSKVFRWIYSVLSPTEFRAVPYLKITPDKDDPAKVVCAVQFWRWYQPAGPS